MPNRKAILAAATFLSLFPIAPAVAAQNERTLTEAPAQTGPVVPIEKLEAIEPQTVYVLEMKP